MAQSTSSGFHTHSSWGRTRRPKTVSSKAKGLAPAGTLETARAVAASAVGNLAANLDSATEGQNGYATENQRFLHVTVSAAQNKSVKIYVYNYAIRVWAPLMVNDGDGSFSQATASTVDNGTANLQPQTFIFEIAGADRVAFVSDDAPTVHAACSTF